MRTRRLGTDGPEVSLVGLGCNNFGRRLDAAATRLVVDAALGAGITLLDTADIYGDGDSEAFLGEALHGRRERAVLATKFGGGPMLDEPGVPRGTREHVRWALEGSLRRLRTDRIDLYQYHKPDGVTPLEETLGAMRELVEEGKVLHLGSSNFEPDQLEAADRIARLVSAQNRYSLVRRQPELLETCGRLGIGLLPYFPLESGLLTGKYRRGEPAPEGTRLAGAGDRLTDEAFDQVEALERFADERGLSLLEVAIGGLAAQPGIGSVIAGATEPEQARANAAAGAWEPSAEDMEALAQMG